MPSTPISASRFMFGHGKVPSIYFCAFGLNSFSTSSLTVATMLRCCSVRLKSTCLFLLSRCSAADFLHHEYIAELFPIEPQMLFRRFLSPTPPIEQLMQQYFDQIRARFD